MIGTGILPEDSEEVSEEEYLTRPPKPSCSLPVLDDVLHEVFGRDLFTDDYILDNIQLSIPTSPFRSPSPLPSTSPSSIHSSRTPTSYRSRTPLPSSLTPQPKSPTPQPNHQSLCLNHPHHHPNPQPLYPNHISTIKIYNPSA